MKVRLIFGKHYERVEVERDGKWEKLDPKRSQKVWNHSPDGFAWGYGGSGPAQLALALLLEAGLDDETAVRLHQQFKSEVVARWTHDGPGSVDEHEIDMLGWVVRGG